MPSQPGTITDLNIYTTLRQPNFIISAEAEGESNNSSRQEFANQSHQPAHAEMGLGFMVPETSDDSRYASEGSQQQSTSVYGVDSHTSSTTSSAVPYFTNVFPPTLNNAASFSNTQTPYLNNSVQNYCLPDIKQSFNSYSSSLSDMPPPPTRSPHLSQITSPMSVRDIYGTNQPALRRHSEAPTRSPPSMRGVQMSPSSSSGFASPPLGMGGDSPSLAANPNGPPPLKPTELLYQNIQTTDGRQIRPEIIAKIDKGFFLAENDWTCYRRNYFQVSCSFTLDPVVPAGTVMHLLQNGQSSQIQGWAMSIAAVVDGENGKGVELVMHTPKRDKGPQLKVEKKEMLPRPVNQTLYNGVIGSSLGGVLGGSGDHRPIFDSQTFASSQSNPPTEFTFERIQFKQATANNGKRRARQQYYHLIIELYADLGGSEATRFTKVARRVSAQMVVRGRSPGHYHAERRGSNASGGAGTGNGLGGSLNYPGSTFSGAPNGALGNSMSLGGYTGGSGSYGTQRSRRYLENEGISMPPEPIISQEDQKGWLDQEGYTYYPQPLRDSNVMPQLPCLPQRDLGNPNGYGSGGGFGPQRIKQEYSQHGGYGLPSLTSMSPLTGSSVGGGVDNFGGRTIGRWEGVSSSRGYYPNAILHGSEINSS